MADFIVVNKRQMKMAINLVEAYLKKSNERLDVIENSLDDLALHWEGIDELYFTHKWQQKRHDEGETKKTIQAMMKYGEKLVLAAERYRKAQEESFDEANKIPPFDVF